MKFIKSVGYAWQGIAYCFKNELNFRIEVAVAVVVVFFGFMYDISNQEWLAILLNIGIVLSLELLNTALETICDRITTDFDKHIKTIKDVAAGATLLAAFFAFICGCIIFIPKFFIVFN